RSSVYPHSLPSVSFTTRRPPSSTLFPSTTLFRSVRPEELDVLDELGATQPLEHRVDLPGVDRTAEGPALGVRAARHRVEVPVERDRKSTRLNSSHVKISYAVFCLKKKNTIGQRRQ